jgi:hypothetical protein
MNGLLHRLAARAIGNAMLVRSNARLPYGGGATWADIPGSDLAGVHEMRSDAPGQRAPMRRMLEPSPIEPGLPPKATTRDARDTWFDGAPPGVALPIASDSIDQSGPGVAALPEKPPRTAMRSTGYRETQSPMTSRKASTNNPDPGIVTLPEQPPLVRTESPLAAQSELLTEQGFRSGGSTPTGPSLLMLPADDRSASAPAMRSATGAMPQLVSRLRTGADVADETTEVHIHIGRIDVTAVLEAPPPRRKQAPIHAPMSLDAYLARRSRS